MIESRARIDLLLFFFPFTAAVLFLDSRWFADRVFDGQILSNVLAVAYFGAMIWSIRDPRLVRMMWLAVPISAIGEIAISMGLEVWVYRNAVVPIYVPFGHAIVIGTGFLAAGLDRVRNNAGQVIPAGLLLFPGLMIASGLIWNDTLSLACLGFYVLGIGVTRDRLPYVVMPIPVLFVEIVGTVFGCWRWPPEALGLFTSVNPPPGAVGLYVMLDLLVMVGAGWLLSRPLRKKRELAQTPRNQPSEIPSS